MCRRRGEICEATPPKSADREEVGDREKNEISKDVSAFANSAGGVIIYGIVEKDNLPDRLDCGFDPTEVTREWIEQVINSRIHRRIDSVRIHQIDLSSKSGRVAYVIEIPSSTRAPAYGF